MNKFCKVFAIVLSVLMLVSMATACKKSEEDLTGLAGSSFNGGDLSGGYETNEQGQIVDDQGKVIDTETDDKGNIIDKETGEVIGNTNDGGNNAGGNNVGGNNVGGNTNTPGANNGGNTNKPGANNGGNTNKPGANNGGNTNKPGTNNGGGTTINPGDDIGDVIGNYTGEVKWSAEGNPLVTEVKEPNTGVEPGFDVDTTNFVKNGIKIADLKKKSLTLITSIRYATFNYRDEKGAYVTEWEWFDSLKSTYGLKINYIKSRFDKSVQQSLTYMNAGKQLDVIPTHVGGFPKFLNLSQPLDPYINLQNIDNSPGINTMTLEETKWGGSYRCIAPIGSVNVIWYNESLTKQFGLTDPHTLWQQGKWNWDTFKTFVTSVPATTPDGKTLRAYNQCTSDMMYSWPLTNGLAPIQIDTKASKPALINNWTNEKTVAAWEFISNVVKSVKFGGALVPMYEDGTVMMSDTVHLQSQWDNYEYTRGRKYNWVPFPAATTDTGRCIAFDYGYTHMIPRKVAKASNIPYAVKFMELWACRFTEAMFDYLATTKCYNFDYAARKEYFEFVVSSTYFGVQMNEWDMLSGESATAKNNWFKSLTNPSFNIRTETEKVKNVVQEAIDLCLAYGQ